MPWTNKTYDQLSQKQQETLQEVHKHRCNMSDDMILGEIQVRTEFNRRDFTKRQMNIMVFIYNYSVGFGKEWAVIPKMKDFELSGVLAIKAKNELSQLVEMSVIDWNQEENQFRIKHPKEWTVPFNSSFSFDRSQELNAINLIHAGIDVSD